MCGKCNEEREQVNSERVKNKIKSNDKNGCECELSQVNDEFLSHVKCKTQNKMKSRGERMRK